MSQSGEYVPSPRPNPRLRPEGAAYAERNRGTMERWFDYSETLSAGDAAASDKPSQSNDTSGEDHPQPQTPPEGGADSSTEAMQGLTESYSELSMRNDRHDRAPADEAKEYALRNRGSMDHIINNYNVTSPTSPPPASTQDVASTHTQATDSGSDPCLSPSRDTARQRTLHQESKGRSWDESRPAPRIRPDGESIAMKNSTDSMFDIMRTDNIPQSSPVKTSKTSRHSEESVSPPQSASQPRTRPGEGAKNYERAHNQSEMAAILRGEGDKERSTPARNIRHLQRSELW